MTTTRAGCLPESNDDDGAHFYSHTTLLLRHPVAAVGYSSFFFRIFENREKNESILLFLKSKQQQSHIIISEVMRIISVIAFAVLAAADDSCDASDQNLIKLRETLCYSLACSDDCPCSNSSSGEGDWPNQVVYMKNIMVALTDPSTCLDTPTAKDVVTWLDVTDVDVSVWWYTWVVFQVQYYDMPRQPGARIESPATLGRKCWAFAYLDQIWVKLKPALSAAMANAGLSLSAFFTAYDAALPLTMNLCDEVMANCFVNASYNPDARNGTCPGPVDEFYVGFQWENGNNNAVDDPGACPVGDCWRNDSIAFPFPRYMQTDEWRDEVTFAVNTALNYII
jgi:hypothetical protein